MSNLGWYQLGGHNNNDPIFYNKTKFYSYKQKDIEFNVNSYVTCAPNGGPIAVASIKSNSTMSSNDVCSLNIYTQSGNLLRSMEWKEDDNIVEWGFDGNDNLILISIHGSIIVFSVLLQEIQRHDLNSHFHDVEIASAKVYSKGVVILLKSSNCCLFTVEDITRSNPRIEEWKCMNEIFIPDCPDDLTNEPFILPCYPMAVSEVSTDPNTHGIQVAIGLPATKEVVVADIDSYVVHKLNSSPLFLATQPEGSLIAVFKEDFTLDLIGELEIECTISTNTERLPSELKWCASNSLALYWSPQALEKQKLSLLLIIGPERDFFKLLFDSQLHIQTEIDGLRILTEESSELLYQIPDPLCKIFKVGSMDPATILYEAYSDYENMDPTAVKNLRRLGGGLNDAVLTCIQAAGHEIDILKQSILLQAASLGKAFPKCKKLNHDLLKNMVQKLQILNELRSPQVGIPITIQQFDNHNLNDIIKKLIHRNLHGLAQYICSSLHLNETPLIHHWSTMNMLRANQEETINILSRKLKKNKIIPITQVALWAYENGKIDMSKLLLDMESSYVLRVNSYIEFKRYDEALQAAIHSKYSDLIFLVLTILLKTKSYTEVIDIVNNDSQASCIAEYWAKSNGEQKFLKMLYDRSGKWHMLAIQNLKSFRTIQTTLKTNDYQSVLDETLRNYSLSEELFKSTKNGQALGDILSRQKELIRVQVQMSELTPNIQFVDMSLRDTIFHAYYSGLEPLIQLANRLIQTFNLNEKKACWIKVQALSKAHRWDDLFNLSCTWVSKKKHPPIGYRPFAEECLKEGNKEEAKKYIAKVYDSFGKVRLYTLMEAYDDAISTAFAAKSVEMLNFIYRCSIDKNVRNLVREKIDVLS